MDKLQLSLDINEINILLSALSQMPYGQVSNLIGNISQQAQEQLPQPGEPELKAVENE